MLIYDGECQFCRCCANWVLSRGKVPMSPSADLDLDLLGLTPPEVSTTVWWVTDRERLSGHRAVARVLRELSGVWGIAGRVIAVPPLSWLGNHLYRWVANIRTRFHFKACGQSSNDVNGGSPTSKAISGPQTSPIDDS